MKITVCFECQRFFEENFLFCPYCGKRLQNKLLSDNEEAFNNQIAKKEDYSAEIMNDLVEKINEFEENYLPTTKMFYDSLPIQEKTFIDKFYCLINNEFPLIKMKHTVSNTYFYREIDKFILDDYADWFFFTKKDGMLQLRYRLTPTKKTTIKAITISEKTNVDEVAKKLIEIIKSRD